MNHVVAHVDRKGAAEVAMFEHVAVQNDVKPLSHRPNDEARDALREPSETIVRSGNHVFSAALSGKLNCSLVAARRRGEPSEMLLVEGDIEANLSRLTRFGDFLEKLERFRPPALVLERKGAVEEISGRFDGGRMR